LELFDEFDIDAALGVLHDAPLLTHTPSQSSHLNFLTLFTGCFRLQSLRRRTSSSCLVLETSEPQWPKMTTAKHRLHRTLIPCLMMPDL
jgi:hypothetical protein